MLSSNDKLKNFPVVNWISLKDSTERQDFMNEQLKNFNLDSRMIEAYDGRLVDYTNNPMVKGVYFDQINSGMTAISLSHLKMIKNWYDTSNENYGFFCEDDVTFETINYWNFTWDDIMNNLPNNWQTIQLSLIKGGVISDADMKFVIRPIINWSAAAYIMTKEYAKEILSKYICDDLTYKLEVIYNGVNYLPLPENVLFGYFNSLVYTLPLFVANTVKFARTLFPMFYEEENLAGNIHSSNHVLNWWKNNANNEKQLDILFKN